MARVSSTSAACLSLQHLLHYTNPCCVGQTALPHSSATCVYISVLVPRSNFLPLLFITLSPRGGKKAASLTPICVCVVCDLTKYRNWTMLAVQVLFKCRVTWRGGSDQHVLDKRAKAGHVQGVRRRARSQPPVSFPLDYSYRSGTFGPFREENKALEWLQSDPSVWQLCTPGIHRDFITHQSAMWRLPEAAVVLRNIPARGDRVSRICGKCFKPCPPEWDVSIQALVSDRLINKENVKWWTSSH